MPHEIKRIALSLSLFLGLAQGLAVAADDSGVIHEKNATVYTGNFAVIEKTAPGDAATQSPEDNLGLLGDYAVVAGQKNPHHLAYVRKNNGQGYLILDRLYVKCARKKPCEIPEEYRAVKLSSRLYEVPVSDYESWKTMPEELRRIPGVIKVSASYGYGLKPDLK